jgi:hypothetical protein
MNSGTAWMIAKGGTSRVAIGGLRSASGLPAVKNDIRSGDPAIQSLLKIRTHAAASVRML